MLSTRNVYAQIQTASLSSFFVHRGEMAHLPFYHLSAKQAQALLSTLHKESDANVIATLTKLPSDIPGYFLLQPWLFFTGFIQFLNSIAAVANLLLASYP